MTKKTVLMVGTGTKATLATWHESTVATNSVGGGGNVLRLPEQLPILLAGPMIRRVEPGSATIWTITSVPVAMDCTVMRSKKQEVVGRGKATSEVLGERLYLTLISVIAQSAADREPMFPRGELLTYNCDVTIGGLPGAVGFNGDALLSPDEVAYLPLGLPSFFLPGEGAAFNNAHASCRKFHGPDNDATLLLDCHLNKTAEDVTKRPAVLLLTGDQIYADDVKQELIDDLAQLGRMLLGWEESIPMPTANMRTVDLKAGARVVPGFTVDKSVVDKSVGKNHLLGIGDYIAMYLLAFSSELWHWGRKRSPALFPFAKSDWLEALAKESAATRRVLANCVTYMMFDDHEITDDWNLTENWVRQTSNPTARRVIANGLATYCLFQGIGNDPAAHSYPKFQTINYLQGRGSAADAFESAMHSFHGWRYIAQTQPPAIVLDTRTQRELLVGEHGLAKPPGLLNNDGFDWLAGSIRRMKGSMEQPVIIVSPAPVIDYTWIERMVKRPFSNVDVPHGKLNPAVDPEAWSFNDAAFENFLKTLCKSGRKKFVVLSGDVHYSYSAIVECAMSIGGQTYKIHLTQLTSSALKNHPECLKQVGLGIVCRDVEVHHYRQGLIDLQWKFLEFDNNFPRRTLIVDNNVALAHIDDSEIVHRMLIADGEHATCIKWARIARELRIHRGPRAYSG